MRRTLRLLADVKPAAARYLEAGNPTGLTGLYTHSSPRSSLLFLYSRTLEKLQQFPESSLYRKSVEAQTAHRMAIVEAAVPPGYDEWARRAQKAIDEHPEQFSIATSARVDGAKALKVTSAGSVFVHRTDPQHKDIRYEEWDGERDEGEGSEGLRGPEEREHPSLSAAYDRKPLEMPDKVEWESEPQLTADQYVCCPRHDLPRPVTTYHDKGTSLLTQGFARRVEEIENKIGAGLIEEVVQMAESELKLVDILYEAKV
ncbi:ETC complex I subunit conserved region-domain-containing protein [Xylaria venustula]|nr:ETC complex I subunit conserved region-domain-containing protein [Xylaria venustula]